METLKSFPEVLVESLAFPFPSRTQFPLPLSWDEANVPGKGAIVGEAFGYEFRIRIDNGEVPKASSIAATVLCGKRGPAGVDFATVEKRIRNSERDGD